LDQVLVGLESARTIPARVTNSQSKDMAGVLLLLSLAAALPAAHAAGGCGSYQLYTDRATPRGMYVPTTGPYEGTYEKVSNQTYKRSDTPMVLKYDGGAWQFETTDGSKSLPCDIQDSCKTPDLAKWPAGSPKLRVLYPLTWRPAVGGIAQETCAEVMTSGIVTEAHMMELAGGMSRATAMTSLTLDFKWSYGLEMRTLQHVVDAMRGLPIKTLKLLTSPRTPWPAEASVALAGAAPAATSLVLDGGAWDMDGGSCTATSGGKRCSK